MQENKILRHHNVTDRNVIGHMLGWNLVTVELPTFPVEAYPECQ